MPASSSPSTSLSSSPSASVSTSPSASASASPSAAWTNEQVVTLAEAKEVLHVSGSDHDFRIDSLIDAAVSYVEDYQNRKLLNETCVDYLDDWPDVIRPRWSNLVSVTSITYIDTAGTQQTWSSDEYDVDTDPAPGRIEPAYGYSYPTFRGDLAGIVVTYVAGYGDSRDDCPSHTKTAILLLVYEWFHNPGSDRPIPPAVRALLSMNRVIRV